MVAYTANFEYEWDLYGLPISSSMTQKIRKEFEFLFFYCESEGSLLSTNSYSEKFLSKVEDLTGIKPSIITSIEKFESALNWWGKLENITLEREVNSKITSYNLFPYDGTRLISSLPELECVFSEEYIIKDPFGVSGKGNHFSINKAVEKILSSRPMLLEKKHDVLKVYGTTIERKDTEPKLKFQVENFTNKKGAFKGARLLDCYVFEQELLEAAKKVFEKWPIDCIQIDSYLYQDGEREVFRPVVELNYRKTMGYCIDKICCNLRRKFNLIVKNKCLPETEKLILISPNDSSRNFNFYLEEVV